MCILNIGKALRLEARRGPRDACRTHCWCGVVTSTSSAPSGRHLWASSTRSRRMPSAHRCAERGSKSLTSGACQPCISVCTHAQCPVHSAQAGPAGRGRTADTTRPDTRHTDARVPITVSRHPAARTHMLARNCASSSSRTTRSRPKFRLRIGGQGAVCRRCAGRGPTYVPRRGGHAAGLSAAPPGGPPGARGGCGRG